MKDFEILKKEISSRDLEEETIKEYILENTDLEIEETQELVKNLDVKTIEAFEEAMEKVATDYNRDRTPSERLLDYIRSKNTREEIVSLAYLVNNDLQELELDEDELLNLLKNKDEDDYLKDLEVIERENNSFIYDSTLWTRQYAITAVILEEGNILEAIAHRTRRDCKIYPRPVQVTALKLPPYAYKDEEIQGALNKMATLDEYSDIKTVQASNGGICIYSLDHMSEKYAKSLCEEIEVERKKYQ